MCWEYCSLLYHNSNLCKGSALKDSFKEPCFGVRHHCTESCSTMMKVRYSLAAAQWTALGHQSTPNIFHNDERQPGLKHMPPWLNGPDSTPQPCRYVRVQRGYKYIIVGAAKPYPLPSLFIWWHQHSHWLWKRARGNSMAQRMQTRTAHFHYVGQGNGKQN